MAIRLSAEHVVAIERERRVVVNFDAFPAVMHLPHIDVEQMKEALFEFMDDPETCPHGAPIPGNFPDGGDDGWRLLADTSTGERLVIRRISEMVEGDPELLHYCADKNLRPGVVVTVREIGPDRVFILDVDGDPVAVSSRLSAHVFCEAIAA